MDITWLGTASLVIETNENKILFDPYLRNLNKRLPKFPYEKVRDADAIFITHPHLDHYADLPEIMKHTDCPIYTNARGIEIARKMRFDMSRIKRIDCDDVITFGNLTVTAYRGRHVEFDRACVKGAVRRALKGQVFKALKISRQNRRFSIHPDDIFTYGLRENGKTVLIMGSANKDEQTRYPESDILIYPYQGRSDMLDYSLKLVKSFSPRTVVLDHFDDAFPPASTSMNTSEFKQCLESQSDIKVIIPTEYEKIAL